MRVIIININYTLSLRAIQIHFRIVGYKYRLGIVNITEIFFGRYLSNFKSHHSSGVMRSFRQVSISGFYLFSFSVKKWIKYIRFYHVSKGNVSSYICNCIYLCVFYVIACNVCQSCLKISDLCCLWLFPSFISTIAFFILEIFSPSWQILANGVGS